MARRKWLHAKRAKKFRKFLSVVLYRRHGHSTGALVGGRSPPSDSKAFFSRVGMDGGSRRAARSPTDSDRQDLIRKYGKRQTTSARSTWIEWPKNANRLYVISTMGRGHRKNECTVPSIRLCGKWLAALGLVSGQKIRVMTNGSIITIAPVA